MLNIDITVCGLGGCINFEALVIERLFKELGYKVEVDNDHPFVEHNPIPQTISETEDEFIDRVKNLKNKGTIRLKVDHCP